MLGNDEYTFDQKVFDYLRFVTTSWMRRKLLSLPGMVYTFFFVLSFLFLLYEKIPPIIWVFSRYHQPILCKCGLLLHAWLAKSWKLSLIHLFSRIKIVRRHYKFCLMCFYYFSFFYYREVRYFSGKNLRSKNPPELLFVW